VALAVAAISFCFQPAKAGGSIKPGVKAQPEPQVAAELDSQAHEVGDRDPNTSQYLPPAFAGYVVLRR
jgi:hypothetical protein